jgi:hypothetical protein
MRALVDSWRSFATWMRLLLSNRTVAVGFVMFIIIVLAALLAPWPALADAAVHRFAAQAAFDGSPAWHR